jgi:hypothetical protein
MILFIQCQQAKILGADENRRRALLVPTLGVDDIIEVTGRWLMKIGGCAIAGLWIGLSGAWGAEFPVKDAQHALAIARQLCRHIGRSSLTWNAGLDNNRKTWIATTLPAIKKCGDPLLVVKIPVDGPPPQLCERVPVTRSIFCDCPPKGYCAHPSRQPEVPAVPAPKRSLVRKRDA